MLLRKSKTTIFNCSTALTPSILGLLATLRHDERVFVSWRSGRL